MNQTIDLLTSHRSIRKFTDEPVDPALFTRLVEAAQASASSSFLQGVTIIRVTDPGKRVALRDVAGGQAYVETAPEFLVFCADLSRPMRCCRQHGGTPAEGLTEQFVIATVDAALYAQNLVIAAESAALASVTSGHCATIRQGDRIAGSAAAGLSGFRTVPRSPGAGPRGQAAPAGLVTLKTDSYSTDGEDEAIAAYDEEMRTYYANRSANIKIQGWSDQMAGLLAKEGRQHMLAILQTQGFLTR